MSHGSTTAELPSGTASKAARSGAGLAFRPFGTHEAQLLGRLLVAQYGGCVPRLQLRRAAMCHAPVAHVRCSVQSTDVPAADITPRLYTSEAVFEDPMIHVSGLPNIQARAVIRARRAAASQSRAALRPTGAVQHAARILCLARHSHAGRSPDPHQQQ